MKYKLPSIKVNVVHKCLNCNILVKGKRSKYCKPCSETNRRQAVDKYKKRLRKVGDKLC